MLTISESSANLINSQISHELHNEQQYRCFGSWAENMGLKRTALYFYAQANDESGHAKLFTDYLREANVQLALPAIEAPANSFKGCEEIAQLRLELEGKTTDEISALMDAAMFEKDYGLQDFLQPLAREQVSELSESLRFQSLVKIADGNLIELDLALG